MGDTFPVTPFQRYLLDNLTDPEAPVQFRRGWLMLQAIRLRPGLDPRRLSRTVDRLLRRHDGLRSRFFRENGDWRVEIADRMKGVLTVEDHGTTPEPEQRALAAAALHAPLDVTAERLVDIRLLRFGTDGDILLLRLHHAVTDAYGMIVLVEDLIQSYLGVPIRRKARGFGDYLANLDARMRRTEEADAAFWDAMHYPVIPAPAFGRTALGFAPVPVARGWDACAEFRIPDTAARAAAILERSKASGVSPFALASSAFLEAICAIADVPEVYFCTTVGRTDGAFAGTIVDSSQYPVLRYRAAPSATPEARAESWAAGLAEALAHLPSEAASRGGPAERAIHAANGYPRQFALWMTAPGSRMDGSVESALFRAEPEKPLKLGPIEATPLKIRHEINVLEELCLKFESATAVPELSFLHAAEGYSDADLLRLSEAMPL